MTSEQVEKQLRSNAQAILDADLSARGHSIPAAAIAGALTMGANEIGRLRKALKDLLQQIDACDGTSQLNIEDARQALSAATVEETFAQEVTDGQLIATLKAENERLRQQLAEAQSLLKDAVCNGDDLAMSLATDPGDEHADSAQKNWGKFKGRLDAIAQKQSPSSAPANQECTHCLGYGGKPICEDGDFVECMACKGTGKIAPAEPLVQRGHFWRGEVDRFICQNCGKHYDSHIFSNEDTRCPVT